MSQQAVGQAARRSALDAQAVLRTERVDRERRLEGPAVAVLTALGERDAAVQDADKLGEGRLFMGPAFHQADDATFRGPDLGPITYLEGANRALERGARGRGDRAGRPPITSSSSDAQRLPRDAQRGSEGEPAPMPLADAEVAGARAALKPELTAVIGVAALVVIIWIMVAKPF
jgi:hypothetical protein